MKPKTDETKTKRTYNRKSKPVDNAIEPKILGESVVLDQAPIDPIVYGIWITNRDGQSGWHTDAYGIVFNTTFKCVANAQLHNLNMNTSSHRTYEIKEMA
jgi:hypothetical protein